jgi:hypothetical protein
MLNEKSPLFLSTKDVINFLENIRIMLGFTHEYMDFTILLLDKCETCSLNFRNGKTLITFNCYGDCDDVGDKKITCERYIRQDNYANSITFDIPRAYIELVKKRSSFAKPSSNRQ